MTGKMSFRGIVVLTFCLAPLAASCPDTSAPSPVPDVDWADPANESPSSSLDLTTANVSMDELEFAWRAIIDRVDTAGPYPSASVEDDRSFDGGSHVKLLEKDARSSEAGQYLLLITDDGSALSIREVDDVLTFYLIPGDPIFQITPGGDFVALEKYGDYVGQSTNPTPQFEATGRFFEPCSTDEDNRALVETAISLVTDCSSIPDDPRSFLERLNAVLFAASCGIAVKDAFFEITRQLARCAPYTIGVYINDLEGNGTFGADGILRMKQGDTIRARHQFRRDDTPSTVINPKGITVSLNSTARGNVSIFSSASFPATGRLSTSGLSCLNDNKFACSFDLTAVEAGETTLLIRACPPPVLANNDTERDRNNCLVVEIPVVIEASDELRVGPSVSDLCSSSNVPQLLSLSGRIQLEGTNPDLITFQLTIRDPNGATIVDAANYDGVVRADETFDISTVVSIGRGEANDINENSPEGVYEVLLDIFGEEGLPLSRSPLSGAFSVEANCTPPTDEPTDDGPNAGETPCDAPSFGRVVKMGLCDEGASNSRWLIIDDRENPGETPGFYQVYIKFESRDGSYAEIRPFGLYSAPSQGPREICENCADIGVPGDPPCNGRLATEYVIALQSLGLANIDCPPPFENNSFPVSDRFLGGYTVKTVE